MGGTNEIDQVRISAPLGIQDKLENASATGTYADFEITLPANSFVLKAKRTAANKVIATLHTAPAGSTSKEYELPLIGAETPFAVTTSNDEVCRGTVAVFAKEIPGGAAFAAGQPRTKRESTRANDFKPVEGDESKGWGVVTVIAVKAEPKDTGWSIAQVIQSFTFSALNRVEHPDKTTPPQVRSKNKSTPGYDQAKSMTPLTRATVDDGVVFVDTPHVAKPTGVIAGRVAIGIAKLPLESVVMVNGEDWVDERQFKTFFSRPCHGEEHIFVEVTWTAKTTIKYNTKASDLTGKSAFTLDKVQPNPTETPAGLAQDRIIPLAISVIKDFESVEKVP